jgi:GH43 family beta-xylosidase
MRILLLLLLVTLAGKAQTFTNPLLSSGADPWCTFKNGYYYYTNTTGHNITIWKTKSMGKLSTAEKKVVYTPPATGPYSKELWAPEIHFSRGKWYIYFTADSGRNEDHRLYVLENSAADPLSGQWVMKGKLTTPDDKWSIDGSVFEHQHQLYLIWSGWEGDINKQQNIYIAKMSNPWTVTGGRTKISAPSLEWEMHGDLGGSNHVYVNEGPEILIHGDKIHLIYSASGCWTDFYSLGMITASAKSDLMKAESWKKYPQPVFNQCPDSSVYATGHNAFFKTPDGRDWILYHANDKPGEGCGRFRTPRAQPFTWKADGTPDFGKPRKVKETMQMAE